MFYHLKTMSHIDQIVDFLIFVVNTTYIKKKNEHNQNFNICDHE